MDSKDVNLNKVIDTRNDDNSKNEIYNDTIEQTKSKNSFKNSQHTIISQNKEILSKPRSIKKVEENQIRDEIIKVSIAGSEIKTEK